MMKMYKVMGEDRQSQLSFMLLHNCNTCFAVSAKSHQAKLEYQIKDTRLLNHCSCRYILLRSQLHIFLEKSEVEFIKPFFEQKEVSHKVIKRWG